MIILDTHAFVWLASDQEQLPLKVCQLIRTNAGNIFLSAVSALEIALLVKRNRLRLPLSPEEFIERAITRHELTEIPLTRDIACLSASLPDIHNDPFDRIIIATARRRNLVIISKDTLLPRYPEIQVVWN